MGPEQVVAVIVRPVLDDTIDPNWGDQITDAINFGMLPNYASAATRLAAIPAPASGYSTYIDSGAQDEGPEYFNGLSWTKPWNMPWAYVGNSSVAADQTGITTAVDLTGFSLPINAVTGRRYRASFLFTAQQLTAQGSQVYVIDVNGVQTTLMSAVVAPGVYQPFSGIFVFTVTAGVRTVKLRGQTSAGTLSILSASQAPGRLLIEDVGPSGAPT